MSPVNLFSPSPEHTLLRSTVHLFVRTQFEPQALEPDQQKQGNVPLFRRLGGLGLLGITIPVNYSGAGIDTQAASIAHEEGAAADPRFCPAYLAHVMLFVNNFSRNANELQRSCYFEKVISSAWVSGRGVTEPAVGTKVLGMQCDAERRADACRLTGHKMFITQGALTKKTLDDSFFHLMANLEIKHVTLEARLKNIAKDLSRGPDLIR